VREQSKNRLALITGRYAARQHQKRAGDPRALADSFRAVRAQVIRRFAAPSDITADQVEQLVIDAIEHIFACCSI
jgi:hypothetical protein